MHFFSKLFGFFIAIICFGSFSLLGNPHSMLVNLAEQTKNPNESLDKLGGLEVLGNTSLDKAQIVFLPEIHDNAKSLLTQLIVLAREKRLNGQPVVLDESLKAFKKSSWDIFTQKSLEVIAAQESKRRRLKYSPKKFESLLRNLANTLRRDRRALSYVPHLGLWSAGIFRNQATPFFGWDKVGSNSMTKRNMEMVKTLDRYVRSGQRVFVMLGARHVPHLEFEINKKFLCDRHGRTALFPNF